ncbi:hypothetical protein SH467x_000593 [Pirellulaceae bacterium SH467]
MSEGIYSAVDYLAAKKANIKKGKAFDLFSVASEVAAKNREVDEQLIKTLEAEGIGASEFDATVRDFVKLPALKAASADGDRSIEPVLERLLNRLDPAYQQLARTRDSLGKHSSDHKTRLNALSIEIAQLENRLKLASDSNNHEYFQKKVDELKGKMLRQKREAAVAEILFLQARDNCLLFMRGQPLVELPGVERALFSHIENEIADNEKANEQHGETIAMRTRQLREIDFEKMDPSVSENSQRTYSEEIARKKLFIERNKALNAKLKAWLTEIQPAEMAVL